MRSLDGCQFGSSTPRIRDETQKPRNHENTKKDRHIRHRATEARALRRRPALQAGQRTSIGPETQNVLKRWQFFVISWLTRLPAFAAPPPLATGYVDETIFSVSTCVAPSPSEKDAARSRTRSR